jgi:V8-like Glu-specific endopeptidase
MALNESRLAYEAEYDIMAKALESEYGVRVGYPTEEEAKYNRMRLNQARQLDRRFNHKRYPPDHPMHQHSEYDALTFRIRKDGVRYWLYADRKPAGGIVEEVTKDNKPEPVRQVLSYRRF